MDVGRVAEDLAAEQSQLDRIVAFLAPEQWEMATASPGWSIADQVGHLTYFDTAAAVAINDPEAFRSLAEQYWRFAGESLAAADSLTLSPYRAMGPVELLAAWRRSRTRLLEAAATLEDDMRVNWYGPSMGSKSFLSARLMEVWAHGQDIADAIGFERENSDTIAHVTQLGFITRGWSYSSHGIQEPAEPIRLELTAPSGELWNLGPDHAAESISGPAVDFCLVVTQRRHLDDTALVATPLGREWMLVAQAFAGPPTDGPDAGTRP